VLYFSGASRRAWSPGECSLTAAPAVGDPLCSAAWTRFTNQLDLYSAGSSSITDTKSCRSKQQPTSPFPATSATTFISAQTVSRLCKGALDHCECTYGIQYFFYFRS